LVERLPLIFGISLYGSIMIMLELCMQWPELDEIQVDTWRLLVYYIFLMHMIYFVEGCWLWSDAIMCKTVNIYTPYLSRNSNVMVTARLDLG
jgi:uncharacterized BrkB/YihY/UPF0761 family membrane protein